jgi:hypothetical protein
VLDSVNFGRKNYLNAHWIGYCRRKKNIRITAVIDYFIDYFYDYINKFIIVSSLFIDTDNILPAESKKIYTLEKEFLDENFIKAIASNTYFIDDPDIVEKQFYGLETHFSLKQSSEDTIRKLSYLTMGYGNTFGHLFFVLEELELIIYPARGGYEFFGIKSRNNKTAMEFFEKTRRKKEFWGAYRAVNNKLKNFPPFQAYLWDTDNSFDIGIY